MKKRPISSTDLNISTISLGTMTFGKPVSEQDAVRLIHTALDCGINAIDTADSYEGYDRRLGSLGGVAERIVGNALRQRRHQAIITTKVGSDVGHGVCLEPQYIHRQAEASLRRLQCDYIDLYELHRPDSQTPLRATLEAMSQLIEAGKIRHWGFSNFGTDAVQEMLDICDEFRFPRPVVMQPSYNWLDRDFEQAFQHLCLSNQIAVTPYQPLHGGLLTGKYHRGRQPPFDSRATEKSDWLKLDNETYDQLEAFEREAGMAGRTPAHHAIQWLLDQKGIQSVIVGVKTIEQLRQILQPFA